MDPTTTTEPPDVGLGRVELKASNGANARIANHGGQVLSWACRGKERLFLSPRATFETGQAIRGGIPVIFPQFADAGEGTRHGFARRMNWESLRIRQSDANATEARFALKANEHTLQAWPYLFRAELTVNLTPVQLSVELQIENLDRRAFEFTAALHTYLRVSDIGAVSLSGLEGRPYLDSAKDGRWTAGSDDAVRFDGEVDRIYPAASGKLCLSDGADTLFLRSHGFCDTVVWNPGRAVASDLSDLGEDEFPHFACVESGVIATPCVITAGATWRAGQCLSIAD